VTRIWEGIWEGIWLRGFGRRDDIPVSGLFSLYRVVGTRYNRSELLANSIVCSKEAYQKMTDFGFDRGGRFGSLSFLLLTYLLNQNMNGQPMSARG
jgi:hypothetical protein